MQCQVCKKRGPYQNIVVGPSIGHVLSDLITMEPTCTFTGIAHSICSRCGIGFGEKRIPPLGHDYQESSRTDPTCTASGSITKTCTRCEETESEDLPALDHNWEQFSHKDPTCTDPGSTEYVCARCQFAKSEPVPALGGSHAWEETSRTEPTGTSPGLVEYTCSTCNAVKTEDLPTWDPAPAPGGGLTMAALLEQMTGVVHTVLGWMGVVAQTVSAQPVLLLCVVLGFIAAITALFKRLLELYR